MSKILKNSSPTDLNGFLDANSEVRGDLRFQNTFRVHGHFNGTVESEGTLVIGEGGVVEGVAKVGELSVSGRFEGRAEAARRIEIVENGHVEGEIESPVLVIESGAFFQGECSMASPEAAHSATPAIVDGAGPIPLPDKADPALQRFALPDGADSPADSSASDG